jgi:hypothetical protein
MLIFPLIIMLCSFRALTVAKCSVKTQFRTTRSVLQKRWVSLLYIHFYQVGCYILILFSSLPHWFCFDFQEKYGPKGQGKTLNAAAAKPVKDGKQRPVVDTNVGLSQRPPWFCRYVTLWVTLSSYHCRHSKYG